MRVPSDHMRTLRRRVDFLKSREHKNSFDLAELGALEWAIVNLQPQPAPVQDNEAHYKGVVEGVRKLFDGKRAQPAHTQDTPDLIAGALGVSRGTAYDMMREALKEASPVQESHPSYIPKGWKPEVYVAMLEAQRPWVGLTDEERNKLWRDVVKWGDPSHDDVDLIKAIEAKLKERNQ